MHVMISPLFLKSTHPGFGTGSSFPSVLECTGLLLSGPLLLWLHYCPSFLSVAFPSAFKTVFLLSFWRSILVCARVTWGGFTLPGICSAFSICQFLSGSNFGDIPAITSLGSLSARCFPLLLRRERHKQ